MTERSRWPLSYWRLTACRDRQKDFVRNRLFVQLEAGTSAISSFVCARNALIRSCLSSVLFRINVDLCRERFQITAREPIHTANLSELVLGCIEADFASRHQFAAFSKSVTFAHFCTTEVLSGWSSASAVSAHALHVLTLSLFLNVGCSRLFPHWIPTLHRS